MSSVQDHTPVVKELSERRPLDPHPSPSEQLQTVQPPVPRAITSEVPREPSPPRFSQLLDPLPEASDSHPPRRGISTGTNSVTLVNHPGTIGHLNSDAGLQYPSVIQERSQNQSTPTSDRRPPMMYDPIRGDPVVHTQLSDDSMRRVSVPRPRPVFTPGLQDGDGNGGGNGSRVALRGVSGGDSYSHPTGHQESVSLTLEVNITGSAALIFIR